MEKYAYDVIKATVDTIYETMNWHMLRTCSYVNTCDICASLVYTMDAVKKYIKTIDPILFDSTVNEKILYMSALQQMMLIISHKYDKRIVAHGPVHDDGRQYNPRVEVIKTAVVKLKELCALSIENLRR